MERAEGVAGPVVVLVRPQMGENIGAAARAMRNFGLGALRLVAPRDGWPNPRATAMASGAEAVLEAAEVHADVAAAVADLDLLLATTARRREILKPVLSPEAAMAVARAEAGRGLRTGILFGPERAGLENADLLGANAIVEVPANPDFPSLNLAQCVLLLAYEWRRSAGAIPPERLPLPEGGRMATQGEVERFAAELLARLDARGYFRPEHRRPVMQANLRGLLARLPLADADLRTLWGVLRALSAPPGDAGGGG